MEPAASHAIATAAFETLVVVNVRRFIAQNALPALSAAEAAAFAAGVRAVGEAWGWPRVLADAAGELPNDEVARGVKEILARLSAPRAELAQLAKQLIKGCLQPAPAECRLSYVERTASGECRRQELRHAEARVSGTHCVDCPYWTELAPAAHAPWLVAQWHAGPGAFAAAPGVFLPEDFRALRRAAVALARAAGPEAAGGRARAT